MRALYASLIVAVVAGCASVAPAKVQAGDSCYRCHRVIQDTRLAAEIMEQGGQIATSYPFRTAGCLAKYLKAKPAGTSSTIYVTDYQTGHMHEVGSAWFVPTTLTSADGKKSEPDVVAFGSREDASNFRKDVPVKRWAQVLAEAVPD